jgi:hypothetical protein
MNADEIKDSDRLKRWLDGQPATSDAEKIKARCWTSAIAHRAAMRVLPLALSTLHEKTSSRPDLTEIPIWRASIISGVAAVKPSREIRDAATHAGSSAYSTSIDGDYIDAGDAYYAPAYAAAASADDDLGIAGDPAVAAGAAAHSAAAKAANAVPDFWRFIQLDCAALEAGTRLENSPLWSTHNPLAEHWAAVREHILAQDEGWSFWVDWYDKALTGQPQDWTGLLTEVALIPTEDWEKGAEHLNALIAELQLKHAVARTPNAEAISVNPATRRLRVDPISNMPRDLLAEAVEKLRDVVAVMRPGSRQSDQHRALETEVQIVADASERYALRPRMLHSACVRVLRRLEVKIGNGECPGPQQDADVADFHGTVLAVMVDLYDRDSQVREAVACAASARLREPDAEDAAIIVRAADEVAAAAEDDLVTEIPADARAAIDPTIPEAERKEAFYRTCSRLLRVWLITGYQGTKATLSEIEEMTGTAAGISKNVTVLWATSATLLSPMWLPAAIRAILGLL